MQEISKRINKTFGVIQIRIAGLSDVGFEDISLNKNEMEKFNKGFVRKLYNLLDSIPLSNKNISEPDYFITKEMQEKFEKYLSLSQKRSGDLKHIWEKIMIIIVHIEDNKELLEKAAKNSSDVTRWPLSNRTT